MTHEYSTDEVRRILRVSPASLKACLRAALFPVSLKRQPRRFSFQDLLLLKTAKGLCDAGIPVARIRRVLESLKRQLPPEQRLSTVKIYADGRRVVVWDGQGRWQPDSGQFLLNLDAQALVPTRRLPSKDPSTVRWTAEEWMERASLLQGDSPEEARRAYEAALALDATLVAAHINLGLLYHEAGDRERAKQCYRAAVRQAPHDPLPRFNLAVLLEDEGDRPGAEAAYRAVLSCDPNFREAHQNLARLYEAAGRGADAIRHYAAARKLMQHERRGRSGR